MADDGMSVLIRGNYLSVALSSGSLLCAAVGGSGSDKYPAWSDDERVPLALEVITEKGPEGQYLDTEHTRKHFRERWYPDLFERKI